MNHSVTWRSPSNIALVKYWGKYADQVPANPSISFTLQDCFTETTLEVSDKQNDKEFSFEVLLDGNPRPDFKPKIEAFFRRIAGEARFLGQHHLTLKTHNSFPHSSGIASSASGMSALALGLLSMKETLSGKETENFYQTASRWARLGSGSACRSVYGGIVEWGRFAELPESSDEYGWPYRENIHEIFEDYCDYILLVETGSKSISSTAGHNLMNNHPYAERRFLQARENLNSLLHILKTGNLEEFIQLVESEALSLHAMMMTSSPPYLLMKPNTVHVIEEIQAFRRKTGTPVCFTLDAGANVHLLFPAKSEQTVRAFVNETLAGYLQNGKYICDRIGQGPAKISR